VRISERKRTARTRDTSKSASRNTETQRNNQRSLLDGGVGSLHSPVSAFSLKVAIGLNGGSNLIIPPEFAPTQEPLAVWIPVYGRPRRVEPRRFSPRGPASILPEMLNQRADATSSKVAGWPQVVNVTIK